MMNQNQFEQITRKMERRFGKMRKGDEGDHAMLMATLEGNALKINRKYPSSNSRRMREAICLVLYTVAGYLDEEQPDVSDFENEDNLRLKNALLTAFDPFTNPEVKESLESHLNLDLKDPEALEKYFKEPVICLLRIKDSVDLWEKRNGSNGYFQFIENWIGSKIAKDDQLNYTVAVDGEMLAGNLPDPLDDE